MSPAPLLDVRDLHVRFHTRDGVRHAVNALRFDLARGEVLGILGESGSGKSVALRALMGMLPRERTEVTGSVRFDGGELMGRDETAMRRLRGARIAMIFQEPMTALDPVFPVGEQIAETIVRHEGGSRRDAMRRSRELFELVQIPSAERRLKAYPHELSGGMRQRAMIALALSCRPDLLLADEPTTALDVTVQIQIIMLLRRLQLEFGMAVIFVTHDIGVAAEMSDRLAVMYAGRFVETGPAATVIEAPRHPYTEGLLASTVHGSMRGRRLEAIPGMPPDLIALPRGCAFAPRCRHATDACRADEPAAVAMEPDHVTRCRRVAAGEITLYSPTLGVDA
ncbi:MAG: ABC transporter ATP-binding protein [Alphaproteobacteria bacterium]